MTAQSHFKGPKPDIAHITKRVYSKHRWHDLYQGTQWSMNSWQGVHLPSVHVIERPQQWVMGFSVAWDFLIVNLYMSFNCWSWINSWPRAGWKQTRLVARLPAGIPQHFIKNNARTEFGSYTCINDIHTLFAPYFHEKYAYSIWTPYFCWIIFMHYLRR